MTDQKHTKELLPCPFCGGDPEIERMGTSRVSMIIACTLCGCRVESGDTSLSNPRWNMRDDSDLIHREVQLDALTKHRDELRKVVEFYAEHCRCANCGNPIGGKAIEALTKTKESV